MVHAELGFGAVACSALWRIPDPWMLASVLDMDPNLLLKKHNGALTSVVYQDIEFIALSQEVRYSSANRLK